MIEALALIEGYAAQKACKAEQKRIDQVLTLHKKMKDLFARRKRSEYFELNQKIHDALVAMADNESLIMAHSALSKRMRQLRFSGNSSPERWQAALDEHELIALALAKRDAKGIKTAIERHLENTIQRVLKNSDSSNPRPHQKRAVEN